ncbi:MAG: oligopeptide transporter, OPT family [Legionellaceae bacterium]|nr:oligopeptide transporter, OPT family [Legionellaceae bacterium]
MRTMNDLPEITLRSVLLAIVLTLLLAVSNAYLALKLGILTSASIPAAILSMGILRFFRNPSILEHNGVQTAASAGEAIAGGVAYTIPALVIIGYWQHFDYWVNVSIALLGGVLGVLFSIPLRRVLVHEPSLQFPEGRAIAEILLAPQRSNASSDMMWGGFAGAVIQFFQSGLQWIVSSISIPFSTSGMLWMLQLGFSPAMFGAGYLLGAEMALSIFMGAFFGYIIFYPLISAFYPYWQHLPSLNEAHQWLWSEKLRYVGIGAMLLAGSISFLQFAQPLLMNIRRFSFRSAATIQALPRTERDIPWVFLCAGIIGCSILLWILFAQIFPSIDGSFSIAQRCLLISCAWAYVLVVGFVFSVICGYLSAMVGVSASPGSAVIIAGMLFAAWMIDGLLQHGFGLSETSQTVFHMASAITIIMGSIVTGIAAIANDNTQDLKVGHLVGATPWRQELMLLLGVLVSSLVIPYVMEILFQKYGLAGVVPQAGMDISHTLPAPTAALMATITDAVFHHTLPWVMMGVGFLLILSLWGLKIFLYRRMHLNISLLGVAIGLYLPLSTSVPLLVGGGISWCVYRKFQMASSREAHSSFQQRGTLLACGLIVGAALMDVLLALRY